MQKKVKDEKTKMVEQIAKLDALSPLKTLARGYSIITKQEHMIKSVKQLEKGDNITLTLADGKVPAIVK